MSSKINEILKQLAKTKKVHKHKFKEGKPLNIPSLLGTTKAKTIKPKHVALPLSGFRAQWHIAIGLINASPAKKTLYKSYIPRVGVSNKRPKKPSTKITKEQIKTWRKFGAGIFVGHLRPYVERYDREYLYGYAVHVLSNTQKYTTAHQREAADYLKVHARKGAPYLTKQYFLIKYGTAKFHRLGDDTYYQALLRLRKQATTKAELKKIESMLKARKREFRYTKADYYYIKYRKEVLEHLIETTPKHAFSTRSHDNVDYMEDKLERILNPYSKDANKPYFKYLQKEIGLWLSQTAWGKDEEFIKAFYAKHNGLDVAISIGRGREKYAYEELINWFIETGLDVPLHSTNLTWLKNPRLILTMKTQLSKHFSQEEIDEYIRDNLTNPENLSRSGLPDPLVDHHSLYGYFRVTPQDSYFGQEAEKSVTRNLKELEDNFTKEWNQFAKTDRAKRKRFEMDFSKYVPPADLTEHFQTVLEFKRQAKKHRDKQLKVKTKKK